METGVKAVNAGELPQTADGETDIEAAIRQMADSVSNSVTDGELSDNKVLRLATVMPHGSGGLGVRIEVVKISKLSYGAIRGVCDRDPALADDMLEAEFMDDDEAAIARFKLAPRVIDLVGKLKAEVTAAEGPTGEDEPTHSHDDPDLSE